MAQPRANFCPKPARRVLSDGYGESASVDEEMKTPRFSGILIDLKCESS